MDRIIKILILLFLCVISINNASAIVYIQSSDNIRFQQNAAKQYTSNSYTHDGAQQTTVLNNSLGSFKMKWHTYRPSGATNVYTQIRKNGIPYGLEHISATTNSDVSEIFNNSILNAGDTLELWAKTESNNNVFVSFFNMSYDYLNGISSSDPQYRSLMRTGSLTHTIISDNGVATTHWILNGADLNQNVTSTIITYTDENYSVLNVYQTNGTATSNVLQFRTVAYALIDTSQFTLLDDSVSANLTKAIGDMDAKELLIDVPVEYYTKTMGLFFYVFVWGIYASMLYIRQNSWHIPAFLAIILSTLILNQIPDTYRGVVQFGIIAGVFAVAYLMFKSNR